MGTFLDTVPFSGIIRIRDMMYGITDPFRLDQGDVSFDAPDTLKQSMVRAIAENRTHYLQTTGVPRLRELLAEKLRNRNGVPVEDPDEVLVTQGGMHALYLACQALLEPGDEVIAPDPTWPPAIANILAARAVAVRCPLHASLGWRWDFDELAACVTPRTRAIYVNSPHNPTGGLFARADLERLASIARQHGLWILSDESYEAVLFDGCEHVSCASLAGMYERTIPLHTLSKTYAVTGLRVGYLAVKDPQVRERARKVLFLTVSNASSIPQFGAIGALEGSQDCVEAFRRELQARRDLFYGAVTRASAGVLTGSLPPGAFYAFLRIDPSWQPDPSAHPSGVPASRSWALVEELIVKSRIGAVPGADFGPHGEEHVRFCFARERSELEGALKEMGKVFDAGWR